MKSLILALGVTAATLGLAGTADAQSRGGSRPGYGVNVNRGYGGGYRGSSYGSGYGRGMYPGYRSTYGYAPYSGYGYRAYPAYRPAYYGPSYPAYGYGYQPGFSLGIQGQRGAFGITIVP